MGVDVDATKVAMIGQGIPTIVEPGLDELLMEAHSTGALQATGDLQSAVMTADIVLVTVGTPSRLDGELDLTHIFSVSEAIGRTLRSLTRYVAIAIRSTIKPGTCAEVIELIEQHSGKRHGSDFSVVANPEFLREGTAIKDYLEPPYILIGSRDERGAQKIAEIYRTINAPVLRVDIETAEILKYVNNSWHALKVAFANEIGSICKALNIDAQQLMDIFLRDRVLNVSPAYLRPGFAFGGACLPKDLAALVSIARGTGTSAPVLESIAKSNEDHLQRALALIKKQGMQRIGVLGLSFKAATDDVRNSPGLKIVRALVREGHDVKIFDDAVRFSLQSGRSTPSLHASLGPVASLLVATPEELLNHAQVLVIAKKDASFDSLLLASNGRPVIDLVCMSEAVRQGEHYVPFCW